MFILLLGSTVDASNHTKCVSLGNWKYKIQPTIINLHPNQYSQDFHYYPFAVKRDQCIGSCNTVNDLSYKACAPNKSKDLNLSMFNMITEINKSKTLTKNVSCEYKCSFDRTKT